MTSTHRSSPFGILGAEYGWGGHRHVSVRCVREPDRQHGDDAEQLPVRWGAIFGLLATTYGCVTINSSPTGLLLSFKSGIDLGACVYAAAEAIAVQNEYFATPTPGNERKAVLDYGTAVISCAVTGLAATLE